MTEFLVRRFIPRWEEARDPAVRQQYGKLGSIVGILVNLLLSGGKLAAGALSGSVAITADGVNNLSDAGSSLISLVSFRLAARPADAEHPFGHARIEYLSSMAVAVLILRSGGEIIREAMDKLLGQAPTGELVAEIESYVRSYDGVMDCHDLVVHSYGPGRCFATVHAEVPAGRDIMASHDIIDNIERDIFREKGIHLVIHMDPVVTDDVRVEQLRRLVREVLAEVGTELTFHDFRIVAGPSHTNMIFDISAPFAFPLGDSELCRRMEEKLKERDNSLFAVITVDRR